MKKRNSILSRPWLLTPDAFTDLRDAYKEADTSRASPTAGLFDAMMEDAKAPIITTDANGVAVITIKGVLMKNPDFFDVLFGGALDMEQVADALEYAANDDEIKIVLLHITSPGGMVTGTPELGNAVLKLAATKYVYAFADDMMCSAAYWIGSQADAVYSTPSARIGSVGVIMQFPILTEMLKLEGVEMETFVSGVHKSAGSPFVAVTNEQRLLLQGEMDECHDEFKAACRARGRAISDDSMQGQDFSGTAAVGVGMVSGLAENLNEVIEKITRRHNVKDTRKAV